MKVSLRKCFGVSVGCFSFWSILAFAQSSDLTSNLANCKAGRETCDRSKLSQSEATEVAVAVHRQNVVNCRNGYHSCDRSKLTEPETIALAVADHERNVSDCNQGMLSCDRSKLNPV